MSDSKQPYEGEFIPAAHLTPEAVAARKKRNLWLGLALLGFVVLVAITTMIRLANANLSEGAGFYYSNSGGSARELRRAPQHQGIHQALPGARRLQARAREGWAIQPQYGLRSMNSGGNDAMV